MGLARLRTRLYFSRGYVNVVVALARGKKLYDKREAEAAKSAKRTIDRAMKEFNR